jgi:hypothetical protein
MTLSSREKMQRYRDRLKDAGLRPVQIWVPDTRSKNFAAEVRRQSLLVSDSPDESEVMDFIDAVADTDNWT